MIVEKMKKLLKENWLFCVLFILLTIFLFYFTLSEPYHLDTTGYFNSLSTFGKDLSITCGYSTRCMVSYYLLPFVVFGNFGVKLGFVLAALLFFLFSYLFLQKLFTKKTAIVSTLLTILLPASIITITHLKEDFIGIMFFSLALLLITYINRKDIWGIIANIFSAIYLGFALLSKEIYLVFLPFYGLLYLYFFFELDEKETFNWPELKESFKLKKTILLILTPLLFLITLFLIKPDYLSSILSLTNSPYLGQFAGFFSQYFSSGFSLWILGTGLILFIFELFGLISIFLEKSITKKILYGIFILQSIILVFFLCNNTVMAYRNFFVLGFLLLPLSFTSLELLFKKATKEMVIFCFVIFTIIISILLLSQTYTYLDFHKNYNSENEFFSNLNTQNNTIYLCMDDCGLVSFYTKNQIIEHPVDANLEQAIKFVNDLKEKLKTNDVYILPDFFGYDSQGNIQNQIKSNFNIVESKKTYYENYHSMDFGYNLEEYKNQIKPNNCSVNYKQGDNYQLNKDTLVTQYIYSINCNGQTQTTNVFAYNDLVLTKLNIVSIYRLTSK